ncbi:hypothetical protein N431DRAFT_434632 [Stipitochalara longipes BDJ]|nr:hypothetical protein N431DRAFT_434632 [Stipitochalara longipes BDJ]
MKVLEIVNFDTAFSGHVPHSHHQRGTKLYESCQAHHQIPQSQDNPITRMRAAEILAYTSQLQPRIRNS